MLFWKLVYTLKRLACISYACSPLYQNIIGLGLGCSFHVQLVSWDLKSSYKDQNLQTGLISKETFSHNEVRDQTSFLFFPTPAAFLAQSVCLDDTTVKFEIWDTAGQERYHSLAPMYYRGAQAAIVVFDITKPVGGVSYKIGDPSPL